MATVAEAAGTSEPTVIRFCRSVGIGGFRDLKIRLAAAVAQSESYVHKDVTANDSIVESSAKVLDHAIQTLADVRKKLPDLDLEAAVSAIANARQIVFVGLGASGEVANDARHKFFRLGIPCTTAVDSPMLLQMAAIAAPGDVFVAISHTGTWPEMARAMSAAAETATVIALTSPRSALGRVANVVLDAAVAEDTSIFTPMSSRIAQLVILDALQVAVAFQLGPPADQRLRRCKEALARNSA